MRGRLRNGRLQESGSKGADTHPLIHEFLYYWDSTAALFAAYLLGGILLRLRGMRGWRWMIAYAAASIGTVLMFFDSEVYVDRTIWLVREYLHYYMPAVGAIAGCMLVDVSERRRMLQS